MTEAHPTFCHQDRNKNLDAFRQRQYDLVVIGGGINGAGVARDAASRGMSVALVEAQDFASGTSSRSSKLIHGGIRYLENLEFGLVFEALSERRLLFQMAPHLVHPLRFVLPIYKNSRVGMFKMGLGMWLYDALSLFEAPKAHERLNVDQCMERLPFLNSSELLGAFEYSDAYMDDDRLVIETLRSAAGMGAECACYVQAVGAHMHNGKVNAISCRDEISGEEFEIRGKHFVSTVGPWTDELASHLLGQWKPILRPSKGVHLTFRRDRLKLNEAVVMAVDKEERIVFGIPRHEMIIVGTTDTAYSGDPAQVHTEEQDVEYLLRVVDEHFPGAELKQSDIIASYAGVRPLVDDGSGSEGKTSREHLILSDPRNVTFVAGGKYTTYRHVAEQTVETALEKFSLEDQVKYSHSSTKKALNPLVTASGFSHAQEMAEPWAKEFALDLDEVQFLVDRHGMEALRLIEQGQPLGLLKATEKERRWLLEAHYALEQTMCLHLRDFYLRRTPLFLAHPDHGFSVLGTIGQLFAERLKWSDAKLKEEVQLIRDHMALELGWKQIPDMVPEK